MHWIHIYDEDARQPIYSAVTAHYLWKIRQSDGKWLLSRKAKNRPVPYSVYGAYQKLDQAKRVAEAADA